MLKLYCTKKMIQYKLLFFYYNTRIETQHTVIHTQNNSIHDNKYTYVDVWG